MNVTLVTHNHLGDSAILTGAVHNVKLAYPGITFHYAGYAPGLWSENPDVSHDQFVSPRPLMVNYGEVEGERTAARGNVVEGFTSELCRHLGLEQVRMATRVPYLPLTDQEQEKAAQWNGKVLLNANCQWGTLSKRYPYWQEVVNLLQDFEIVQIGGSERRDISPTIRGVQDMRGKTGDLRDLMAMASGCLGVLTPPSAIMNIAAAYGTPGAVVLGAREVKRLTDYPSMEYVSVKCCGYDDSRACVAIGHGARACRVTDVVACEIYSKCMCMVEPERVAEAFREALKRAGMA